MLKPGDKFRVTRKSHWGFGRVFKSRGSPELRLGGNSDIPPLHWRSGELVEFRASVGKSKQTSTFLIPVEWVERVD